MPAPANPAGGGAPRSPRPGRGGPAQPRKSAFLTSADDPEAWQHPATGQPAHRHDLTDLEPDRPASTPPAHQDEEPLEQPPAAAAAVQPRSPVGGGTGLVVALFGYALVVNFLRAGPAGVGQWFRAKFLNVTTAV